MSALDAFRLDGRVAVVTGGNRGLGFAFARALTDAGARVAIAARDAERSAEAAGELGALAVPLDVTDPRSVESMVERVTQELGPIDVLVNNAGVCFHRPALEVPEQEWREVWDVNVDGLWRCSRAVGERMVERVTQELGPIDVLVNNAGVCFHRPALEVPEQEWREVWDVNVDGLWRCSRAVGERMVERRRGSIVNIGSMSGMIVNRPQMQPAYNASKAAVHHLTRSLAAEWAPRGVRVNALAPGYVKTEMSPVDEPRFRRHWVEDAPMERYATPDELGPSLLYLASDASSFVTGSVLVVDGGYTLW